MRKPAQHGTEGGYSRHIRHKETPCQPCRDASMAAQRARRAHPEDEIRYEGGWVRNGLIWRPTQPAEVMDREAS